MTDSENKKVEDISVWDSLKILFGASKGFWLVNVVNFGDGICYFGILILLTRFLGDNLGMSDQTVGMSVSAFTGLVTLFMFGGGYVSDWLGVRKALTFSLLVIGLGRVLLAASPVGLELHLSAPMAWLGLFMMAAGTGVLQPALYAGVKEYADARTATLAYSVLYAIMNLGSVAENFISPFIRTNDVFLNLGFTQIVGLGWGIDGVIWVCSFLTGLMLLIHLTWFTKKVELTCKIGPTVTVAPIPKGETWRARLQALPFFDARFMFFIFILLPVRTLFAHQFLTLPDYIFRAYPEAVSAKYEWINALNPMVIVVCTPLFAIFTRKVKVVDMMIVGTAVTALVTFILVPGPNLNALLIYVLVFSLGEALWSSRFLEYVSEIAPAGAVGAYMGLAGLPWFLAKFTTGLYSGAMLEHFVPKTGAQDTGTLWMIYGVIACISPVALILTRKWIAAGEHHR